MKKLVSMLILMAFIAAAPAWAEEMEKTDWFFGAGYLKSDIDTGITGLTGTATLDEKDDGFKVFGGYQLNPYVGFDFSYQDFGTATLKLNSGDSFVLNGVRWTLVAPTGQLDYDLWSVSLGTVLSLPMDKVTGVDFLKYVTPFAKVGGFYWDLDFSVSNSATTATVGDDGFDLYFGGGLQINIHKNFAISGEWMRYNADGDIDTYGVNLVVRF